MGGVGDGPGGVDRLADHGRLENAEGGGDHLARHLPEAAAPAREVPGREPVHAERLVLGGRLRREVHVGGDRFHQIPQPSGDAAQLVVAHGRRQ